jgi:hypothetical protein
MPNGSANAMPSQKRKTGARVSSVRTKLAFYAWLALLLISLATFALGISGHIVTVLAAPWLSLKTQAKIHASIPVLLTAVKFVTVPLLLLLTPFARHHPTFRAWTRWSKSKFRQLEGIIKIPAQAVFARAKSLWSQLTGAKPRLGAKRPRGR